jgi:hypothetical protein
MQKTGIFFLFLLLSLPVLLYGQEEDNEEDDPSIDSEWDYYETDYYTTGDKTFTVSIGGIFPTVFASNGRLIDHNLTPPAGFTGALAYTYYINSRIYVGGEIQGLSILTISKNYLFLVPIGARVGYQFALSRFEFPVGIALGMAFHRYLELGYSGFYLRGGGSAYFRFNSEWSFGLSASWGWFPEWTPKKSESIDGNLADVMLSVRYHF